jgi:hypothetical protein
MAKELTTLQFDYMDSLVQIKQAEAFDNAIRNFIIDLVEEGFDLNQVRQYLKEREERIFKNHDKRPPCCHWRLNRQRSSDFFTRTQKRS